MKVLPAIFISSLIILLIACGKDKFETKPKLEIKDYNTKEVPIDGVLRIRINYFDKEGDLSETPIIGIRDRLNIFPANADRADTFRTFLPEFPSREKGEIAFQILHKDLYESTAEPDTVVFRFAITDKAGNMSDTVTSDKIVIQFKP